MFYGDNVNAGAESSVQSLMPVGCDVADLHARFANTVNNDSKIFIRINGVNSLVTCTVPLGSQTRSNLVNTDTFLQGDLISVEIDNMGAIGGAGSFMWTATCN